MAEGARLESVYTETYRGFESLPHRHYLKKATKVAFLCLLFTYWGSLRYKIASAAGIGLATKKPWP